MQLADTGFADPQHLADFLEVQFFVVIQRQDQSLTLRQIGNRVRQRALETFVFQVTRRLKMCTCAVLMQPLVFAVL